MRIAMVSEHASPLAVLGGVDAGGQNVHVASLARALAEAGHDVDVYTRRDDPGLAPEVELCPGVRVRHLDAGPPAAVPKDDLLPWVPAMAQELVRWWSAGAPPEVVHAHFWMSGLAALRAASEVPVPVVETFHALGSVKRRFQGAQDTSPPGRVEAEAMIGRHADAVVATCSDEVVELARLGVPVSRVHVVPCGVDVDAFVPRSVPRLPGAPRLLSIGRLVERKGVDTVLQALVELPEARLWVAGGPPREELAADPEARRLGALARELGVADRVRMLGRVAHEDVPALLHQVDLVVATPWYEPFGIVPLEAAACGVPVVGSAVGGLLDSVRDGRTGVLVPPRDPSAVAAAVRALLAEPARRERLGRTARRLAVAQYAWRRVAEGTADVYATLLHGAASAEVAG
ncbi:glycosyltransferase [Cellulomonas massiliensis]|uniref:glycosyltransferase n=1 Tax=Cellulomonas massiliensis TaxID=1465811 RepID=UPI0002DB278A|nr:glycosyltransferase [Cellulomonas massiliensis]